MKLFEATKNFLREYKYTLGQDMKKDGMNLVRSIYRANKSNDRHVLAAAIKSDANYIITFNLKDFPKKVLDKHKIEAINPDDFIIKLINHKSKEVLEAAKTHRERLKNSPKSVSEYLLTLEKQKLKKTVKVFKSKTDKL